MLTNSATGGLVVADTTALVSTAVATGVSVDA
jgi:hypothetical protein